MKFKTLLFSFLFFFFKSHAQFGPQQIIGAALLSSWSIFTADLDDDGFVDVMATEEIESKLVWCKNINGTGNFGPQQIVANNLEYTCYVTSADLDDDGDNDILATSGSNDLVGWFENLDGLGAFGPKQVIASNSDLPKMVIAEDIDGDGDLDALGASSFDSKITWVENVDGSGNFGS
jgi:hypothetical protein